MWSALRSDLKEFTSSLANDGNQVIQMIEKTLVEEPSHKRSEGSDDGEYDESPSILIGEDGEVAYIGHSNSEGNDAESVSSAIQEAIRRMADEDTYLEPLLTREVNGTKISFLNDGPENRLESSSIIDDLNYPRVESGALVFSDDDDPSVIEFLQTFDIQSKTDEISAILEENPDSVQILFESLVPVRLTYEQFWQRYFYRCDENRIRNEWDAYDEQMRRERQEIIDRGKQTVSNLFGGALKLVKRVGNQENGEKLSTYEKYQAELEQKKKSMRLSSRNSSYSRKSDDENPSLLGSLFQGSRPPFVMNTAVDDEEYVENKEDNDGDSFGWGTDEEEQEESDEEDQSIDDSSNVEHEISFESPKPSTEPDILLGPDVNADLDQLREERYQLHETIAMLRKQVHDLSASMTENSNHVEEKDLMTQLTVKDSEVKLLKEKLEMFESENSKIKSIEAQLKDQDSHMQQKILQIELLKSELLQKEHAFDELMVKVDSMVEEEDEKDRTLLQEALETITSLQAELDASKIQSQETIDALKCRFESELMSSKKDNPNSAYVQDADESFRSASEYAPNVASPLNKDSDEVRYLQTELAGAQLEIDKLHDEVKQLKVIIAGQSSNSTVIQSLKSELESNRVNFEDQIENMNLQHKTELQMLHQNLEAAQMAFSASHNEFKDRFDQEISEMKQSHSNELIEIEQKYHDAVQQLKTTNHKLISLQNELESTQSEYESKLELLQNDVDSARNLITELEEEKTEWTQKYSFLETTVNEKDARISYLLDSLKSNLKVVQLEDVIEDNQIEDNQVSTSKVDSIPTILLSPQTSSLSSVVEVRPVNQVDDQGSGVDEERSEGWGDDWSDDDEE